VSSAGLRILLATAKKVKPDGELKICGLNPSVLEVFEMSGFSTIFKIFDNEDAALAG
jgi:anti-sigma B factor antagonist